MTSFSTTTLCDVSDFVVAVCHCTSNLAYELRRSTRGFPAKFKSQTDFNFFRNSFINVLIKMQIFRENRVCIAYAYRKGFIHDRQFVLVYDANTPKNPDCSYCKYDRFDLNELGNEQSSSGLLQDLQRFSNSPVKGLPFVCTATQYIHPLSAHLLGPYKGAVLTLHQQEFNKYMRRALVSVEWFSNDIINCFKFLDFKKNG